MLSSEDIERLLNDNTPAIRVEVLDKIAHAHESRGYSIYDLSIAEQVMRILVRDTEISVREALANRLKGNPHIPGDIVLALTQDIDHVALPVIEESPVLSDNDLIALIHSCKNANKQVAVAARKHISKEVSLALVDTHNPHVVSKLTRNPGAEIPDEAYQRIINDHGKNREIMQAVSERPNLPVTVVEKIISLVSDSLAAKLRSAYDLTPAVISSEAEKTREVATLMLVDGEANRQEVEKLVDQLRTFGRLTPSIILTSLCRGNLYFFESSLAHLSNVPVHNAQILIHDKGGLGFKALYSKAGLPDKFYDACKILLEVVADMRRSRSALKGTQYANAVIHDLLAKTAGRNIDNLSYIIALIRQAA